MRGRQTWRAPSGRGALAGALHPWSCLLWGASCGLTCTGSQGELSATPLAPPPLGMQSLGPGVPQALWLQGHQQRPLGAHPLKLGAESCTWSQHGSCGSLPAPPLHVRATKPMAAEARLVPGMGTPTVLLLELLMKEAVMAGHAHPFTCPLAMALCCWGGPRLFLQSHFSPFRLSLCSQPVLSLGLS